MPWNRPTLKQLYERISADFSGRLLDGGKVLSRSVIAVLAKVWAGACHALHEVLGWLYLQVFVDTAEGWALERWASVWAIYRKQAEAAAGKVIFSGEEGAVIPVGRIVQAQTGQQYATQAEGKIENGSALVEVLALEPGSAGNLVEGAGLTLVSPLEMVNAAAVAAAGGISGGTDAETDESLRVRLLERLRRPPRGGSKSDYEKWAKEVAGVTRAWCYPLYFGPGTVALTFATDNAPEETGGPIPTPEMVQRVFGHIEPLRPATVREWSVFAPQPKPLDPVIQISPNTDSIKSAISAELADLIAREGEPDSVLLHSHILTAISQAPGLNDYVLVYPAANLAYAKNALPTVGTVQFGDIEVTP